MKYFLQALRILLGALFIFSGIVKANDPSGLANKMAEFFEPSVLNMPSLMHHALTLSVIMIAGEIILGVTLLLGFAWRFFAWLMLALNLFFTFLTAYIYYWDVIMHSAKVRECGCFGDCIKISNSATFWKDVALLVAAIILFIYRRRIRPLLPKYPNTAVFVLAVFFAFGVQWYMLEHLPMHDCMPYKVGNSICEGMKQPKGCVVDSFGYVYTFKHNGKEEKVAQENYSMVDSTWGDPIKTETTLIRKGNGLCDPPIKDFGIKDINGQDDYTEAILQEQKGAYILFLRDPATARTDNMDKLQALCKDAQSKGMLFVIASAGTAEANAAWRQKWPMPGAEFYIVDEVAAKTAMRSNPGLMKLEGCYIRGKWSFRDYPSAVQ